MLGSATDIVFQVWFLVIRHSWLGSAVSQPLRQIAKSVQPSERWTSRPDDTTGHIGSSQKFERDCLEKQSSKVNLEALFCTLNRYIQFQDQDLRFLTSQKDRPN